MNPFRVTGDHDSIDPMRFGSIVGRVADLPTLATRTPGGDTILRMRICATLEPVREIEFSALLTLLDVSKSALSKHIAVLADAGYLAQGGRSPRTLSGVVSRALPRYSRTRKTPTGTARAHGGSPRHAAPD
jgi:DNA-binding transcriptional ArsR family regulator